MPPRMRKPTLARLVRRKKATVRRAMWPTATPATQDPCAEREAAGAADREDRVRGQLGEADLDARAPAHPLAEHGAEDEHI